MKYAGIDAGSRAVKIVLYDADTKSVIDNAIADQTVSQEKEAVKLYYSLLDSQAIADKLLV